MQNNPASDHADSTTASSPSGHGSAIVVGLGSVARCYFQGVDGVINSISSAPTVGEASAGSRYLPVLAGATV